MHPPYDILTLGFIHFEVNTGKNGDYIHKVVLYTNENSVGSACNQCLLTS